METLTVNEGSKLEKYETLLPQIASVIEDETDLIANMANVAAMLKDTFGWWWVGFYRVADRQLVLGPFQGPLACTRIGYGRGVCGTAWKERRTVVVSDVDQFPGHIACSSASRSEIVVPLFAKSPSGEADESAVTAVLDIDSAELATFDDTDAEFLEKIAAML